MLLIFEQLRRDNLHFSHDPNSPQISTFHFTSTQRQREWCIYLKSPNFVGSLQYGALSKWGSLKARILKSVGGEVEARRGFLLSSAPILIMKIGSNAHLLRASPNFQFPMIFECSSPNNEFFYRSYSYLTYCIVATKLMQKTNCAQKYSYLKTYTDRVDFSNL